MFVLRFLTQYYTLSVICLKNPLEAGRYILMTKVVSTFFFSILAGESALIAESLIQVNRIEQTKLLQPSYVKSQADHSEYPNKVK